MSILSFAMFSLRHGIGVAASLVLLGAAGYLAFDLHRSGQAEVLRQFNAFQAVLARQSAHEIATYLQECSQDLHTLAKLGSIQRRDRAQMEADIQAYYQASKHALPLAVSVLDEEGAVVFSTREAAGAADYSGYDFFAWAKERDHGGRIYISSPAPPGPQSRHGFVLAKQLYRPNPESGAPRAGRIWTGVLLLSVDLEKIVAEHLAALSPQPKSHRAWMMDRDGTILLHAEHPEMTRQNIHQIKTACAQCHVSFDYARQMLAQRAGTTEYRLKGQPPKLAAFAPIGLSNAPWILVLNAPYAEVTAFSQKSYAKMLLLLGMIAVAVGLASLLVHGINLAKVRAEEGAKQWEEKLQLQEQIRQAEDRYRTLFTQSPDGILMMDPATTLPLEFNEAAHRQLGYSRNEFARLPLASYEAEEESPRGAKMDLERLEREGQARLETRHRTKAGELRDVEVFAQSLVLADRRVLHCIYHDITERKRAEAARERRTAQLEALHQVSLRITAQMEPSLLLETITTQALTLFQGIASGLFLHRPELDALELVTKSGRVPAQVGDRCRKGEGLAGKVWETGAPLVVADYPRWEGRIAVLEDHSCAATMGAPIQWGETFAGVLGVCSNVPGFFTRDDAALLGLFATQAAIAIKNAGLLEQVRQDAAIKTTLLRDVNHRVQNNLMRLVEMVRLEREKAPASEPGTRAALSDLENRLHGMEVVHTMLSRSQWRPLSLGDLVTQIVTAALSGSPTGQQIDLAVKAPAEPLWVVPEQAAAVALIINELATNSVKHAFRNRDQGHLEVRLQVESEAPGRRLVRLEYRDDGPGWPEAVLRGACQHVGLHLIQTHVRSPLRGEMTLRNDGGAVVDLSFKLALAE